MIVLRMIMAFELLTFHSVKKDSSIAPIIHTYRVDKKKHIHPEVHWELITALKALWWSYMTLQRVRHSASLVTIDFFEKTWPEPEETSDDEALTYILCILTDINLNTSLPVINRKTKN